MVVPSSDNCSGACDDGAYEGFCNLYVARIGGNVVVVGNVCLRLEIDEAEWVKRGKESEVMYSSTDDGLARPPERVHKIRLGASMIVPFDDAADTLGNIFLVSLCINYPQIDT